LIWNAPGTDQGRARDAGLFNRVKVKPVIAETVGYGSDIAFSRAYKRRFGVTRSYGRSDLASPYSP